MVDRILKQYTYSHLSQEEGKFPVFLGCETNYRNFDHVIKAISEFAEEIKTEVSKKSSRKSTQRRNTGKSVESGSESIQSKSVTPSEASKIKKETEDVVDELFNNYKKEFE